MNPHDILLTYSEISVALAGFGGIVAAFRQRDRGLSAHDIGSIRFVLEVSLSAILFAFLPGILTHLALGEAAAWRVAAGLLSIGLLALLAYQSRRRTRIARSSGSPPRPIRGRPVLLGLYVVVAIAVAIGALANAITPGLYLVGTGTLIVGAGIEFLAFMARLEDHDG